MTRPDHLPLLQPGDTAPPLSVKDVYGKQVNVQKTKQRFILLAFMRYSGCPWCNLAIHRLALEYPTFLEHDCQVVAFIQSDPKSIKENIFERHAVVPQFSIIADPTAEHYTKYRVQVSKAAFARSITKIPKWVESVKRHGFTQGSIDGNLFTVPAYFLIDTRKNKVVATDYGKSFYDHDTFVKLYEDIFFRSY
jgi:peroxiredoxin